MKCWCGWRIPPQRGQCVNPKHLRPTRSTPADHKPRARFHVDRMQGKRCPFCTGEQHSSGKPCWGSLCDRGPKGARCDCHHQMTGFGTPSGIHKENFLKEDAKRSNGYEFARRIL